MSKTKFEVRQREDSTELVPKFEFGQIPEDELQLYGELLQAFSAGECNVRISDELVADAFEDGERLDIDQAINRIYEQIT